MTLLCVTTAMPGRGCIIWGAHLGTCADGDCRGCMPRPAQVGLLCESCYRKFTAALAGTVALVGHLRTIDRPSKPADGVRSVPGPRMIVPDPWLAADEVWIALAHLAVLHAGARRIPEPAWPYDASPVRGFSHRVSVERVTGATVTLVRWVAANPEDVVAREAPAVAAVIFYRGVQTLLHRYPQKEIPATVYGLKCVRCGLGTMERRPPLEYLDEAVDECRNCGYRADPLLADWGRRVHAEAVWGELEPIDQERITVNLVDDERRIVRQFARTQTQRVRDRIWERLRQEFGPQTRVVWFNTPRPEWDGRTADQMIEAGHGDLVETAIGEDTPA